mmetsp:Transcript_49667/g.94915  ORF Transcript_49667/g.94915 Transcript_49667/m.94915 type:complete len:211 (+) Transcript_49667:211-843(+)
MHCAVQHATHSKHTAHHGAQAREKVPEGARALFDMHCDWIKVVHEVHRGQLGIMSLCGQEVLRHRELVCWDLWSSQGAVRGGHHFEEILERACTHVLLEDAVRAVEGVDNAWILGSESHGVYHVGDVQARGVALEHRLEDVEGLRVHAHVEVASHTLHLKVPGDVAALPARQALLQLVHRVRVPSRAEIVVVVVAVSVRLRGRGRVGAVV